MTSSTFDAVLLVAFVCSQAFLLLVGMAFVERHYPGCVNVRRLPPFARRIALGDTRSRAQRAIDAEFFTIVSTYHRED